MNQLKAGIALNYAIIILSALVGLLYTPYMLRMMGQSEYGLYSLVASVISYLTILDLGFGNAIVRYTAKYRAEGKTTEQYEMFGMFLLLYLGIGLLSAVVGGALYFNIDNMFGGTMTPAELDKARILMIIMVANLAVTFPMSIFGSIMSAYERFVFPKVINILRILLNTVVMIALLSKGYKAIAMVIVQTAFNVATLLINFIYCRKNLHIEIRFGKFKWGFLKEVAIYSLWIFINIILDRIYWSTGQFVLGIVSGTVSVAIFAVAIHLENLYMQFSTAITGVFLPRVTGMVSSNASDKELSDLFIKTGRIQNLIMSLLLFGFIVFGKTFTVLWAGENYSDSFLITLLFFIALYTPLIQNLGITILQARNQMKFRSLLYFGIAFVSLALQFVFARIWGGLGCAIAISGALVIGQGVIMNIYYSKVQGIEIRSFWSEILKMDIIPLLVSAVFILAKSYFAFDTWLSLGLGIVSYSIIIIVLEYLLCLNEEEKRLLTPSFIKSGHTEL